MSTTSSSLPLYPATYSATSLNQSEISQNKMLNWLSNTFYSMEFHSPLAVYISFPPVISKQSISLSFITETNLSDTFFLYSPVFQFSL